MLPASYNVQRWNPAGAGEPLTRRHGMPGSVIAHNQSQFHARSPDLLPLRANWQAFTGLPLSSSVTLRSLPVERCRRLVHPLPSGRAATNSRRLIGSKGRAKTVEASLLARIRGAYLDMCQRQASNLLHEIETEAAASGDDLDSDIAASLEALLAKIQAKREALK